MQDVFKVIYGYYTDDPADTISKARDIAGRFVISSRFIPIIWLNQQNFELNFESHIAQRIRVNKADLAKLEYEALYQQLRYRLQQKIAAKATAAEERMRLLARLAFYQTLRKLRVVKLFLNGGPGGKSRTAGNLSIPNTATYYSRILPVLEELEKMSPIYQFVFSTIVSSDMIPSKLTAGNFAEVTEALGVLWTFTKELVYGLRELAKNIVEHAKSSGLITARVYDCAQYRNLNSEVTDLFDDYYGTIANNENLNKAFFDFHVADLGEAGILEKLGADTSNLIDLGGKEKDMLEHDLRLITQDKIKFEHFLDAKVKLRLNQQAKRATAHLGLLTLSRLIEKNQGMILGSTWKHTRAEAERLKIVVYTRQSGETASVMVNEGTNYHVVLPIDKTEHYKPHFSVQPVSVPEVTPAYIEGIETIFHYRFRPYTGPASLKLDGLFKKNVLRIVLYEEMLTTPESEYWDAFPLKDDDELTTHLSANLICVDLMAKFTDASKLFRFLGRWELEFPGQPLVLYNLPIDHYFSLVRLNDLYAKTQRMPFWNNSSLVLVYSFNPVEQNQRNFFYTDALWGEASSDFIMLNKLIRRTSFNALHIDRESGGFPALRDTFDDKQFESLVPLDPGQLGRLNKFGVFHSYKTLLPLDLLLTDQFDSTLFINNARHLLENHIRVSPVKAELSPENLLRFIELMPGFKIADSHFRIGSKIHVVDFYFAKRFFQNSFFASPVAFLIARSIFNDQLAFIFDGKPGSAEKIDELIKSGLTLLGYGHYSELLLSLVEQFLLKTVITHLFAAKIKEYKTALKREQFIAAEINKFPINHDLISDQEDVLVVKNEKLHGRILLIIPIASTFSTSIKIEEVLKKIKPRRDIAYPHVNVIYVYNSMDELPANDSIEYKFGIVRQDFIRKEVKVNAFFETENSDSYPGNNERFFIGLHSVWQDIEKCIKCFPGEPDKINHEVPLFITDKTQATPVLIFDAPKGRVFPPAAKRSFNLPPEIVRAGHFNYNSSHYQYFIRTDEFFKKNRKETFDWLNSIKNQPAFASINADTSHILIIAPGHFANTGFINLVNEVLFSNAANIIHYDPRNDHIQNFELFYHREVTDPNTKVIFVDDVVTTGATFLLANYFLKHSRTATHGFDAALILLDRASHYVHQNVIRKLTRHNNYYSFANLQLPALSEDKNDCPLCIEQLKFRELAGRSFLDRTRFYFLEKVRKLHCIDFLKEYIIEEDSDPNAVPASGPEEPGKPSVAKRYEYQDTLLRIEATHRVYEWFSNHGVAEFKKYTNFYDWVQELISRTGCPFNAYLFAKEAWPVAGSKHYRRNPFTDNLLIVLASPPFTQHKPLREHVFKWVVEFLDLLVSAILELRDDQAIPLAGFDNLAILVSLAGQLNSNYLISEKFFRLLKKVFSEKGLISVGAEAVKSRADHLQQLESASGKTVEIFDGKTPDHEFHAQHNLQLQEVAKTFSVLIAAQIKELIYLSEARGIRLEKLTKDQLKEKHNPALYTQLLRIIVSENGALLQKFWDFVKAKLPPTIESADDDYNYYDFKFYNILTLLKDSVLKQHYRYKTLERFFGGPLLDEPSFIRYLWLMNYLLNDKDNTMQTLHDKTDLIMERLKEIVFDDGEDSGAFAVVKYIKNRETEYFFAYNDGISGRVDENKWKSDTDTYLGDFLNGIKDNTDLSLKTVIECEKKNGVWYDVYSTENTQPRLPINAGLLSTDYNHLMLMRLNARTIRQHPSIQSEIAQHDRGSAVIGFFSKKKRSIFKVRYLLLLRDALHNFIETHHQNNEFRDWIETLRERRIAILTGHGREMLMTLALTKPVPYNNIVATMLLVQRFVLDESEERFYNLEKGQIRTLFMSLFEEKTKSLKITDEYIKATLCPMGDELFKLNQIENSDKANVQAYGKPFTFDFPDGLLEMICFELFVNAKKNRYISLDDPNFVNSVHVHARRDGEFLHLDIHNTGPKISDGDFANLVQQDNPKNENEPSGIFLIRSLLYTFRLGEISFDRKPLKADQEWFIVKLKLNPWVKHAQNINH